MVCQTCGKDADVLFASDAGRRCFACHKESPRAAKVVEDKKKRRRISITNTRAALKSRPCAYCGAPGPSTVDHYWPKALGGTNATENLRPACSPCNQEKAAMHPYDWEELLQKRRRGLLKSKA